MARGKTKLNPKTKEKLTSTCPDIMKAAQKALRDIRRDSLQRRADRFPYDPEIAEDLCDEIATRYDLTLPQICALDKRFPKPYHVTRWRFSVPHFTHMYARAIAERAHLMAENGLELIDKDVLYVTDDKGVTRIDPGSVAYARLKSDYVKWIASKIASNVWGAVDQIEEMMDKIAEKTEQLVAIQNELRGKYDRDF